MIACIDQFHITNQWQNLDGDAIFQFEKSQIEIVMKQYNVESALQLCGLPYIR